MDAGGRIFPCECSPRPDADLRFAEFPADSEGGADAATDPGAHGEVFNSGMYQLARRHFADPQWRCLGTGEGQAGERGAGRHPYCAKCEPDNTVALPLRIQMRNYFAMAAKNVFDGPSLDLLSTW